MKISQKILEIKSILKIVFIFLSETTEQTIHRVKVQIYNEMTKYSFQYTLIIIDCEVLTFL